MAERSGRPVASGQWVAPAAAVLAVQLWLVPMPTRRLAAQRRRVLGRLRLSARRLYLALRLR